MMSKGIDPSLQLSALFCHASCAPYRRVQWRDEVQAKTPLTAVGVFLLNQAGVRTPRRSPRRECAHCAERRVSGREATQQGLPACGTLSAAGIPTPPSAASHPCGETAVYGLMTLPSLRRVVPHE